MAVFDLTDDEAQMLIRLVRRAIDDDRYLMAPRLDPLKALFAKLDPPKPAAPLPPPLGRVAGGIDGDDRDSRHARNSNSRHRNRQDAERNHGAGKTQ